jgi:hypothetical protein
MASIMQCFIVLSVIAAAVVAGIILSYDHSTGLWVFIGDDNYITVAITVGGPSSWPDSRQSLVLLVLFLLFRILFKL